MDIISFTHKLPSLEVLFLPFVICWDVEFYIIKFMYLFIIVEDILWCFASVTEPIPQVETYEMPIVLSAHTRPVPSVIVGPYPTAPVQTPKAVLLKLIGHIAQSKSASCFEQVYFVVVVSRWAITGKV